MDGYSSSPLRNMREFFDDYVSNDFPNRRDAEGRGFRWPGDEWADEVLRTNTYALLLTPPQDGEWKQAVEVGPGSGKYTEMLLEQSNVEVTAFELSPGLLGALETRCAPSIAAGRLDARLIDWVDNGGLVESIRPLTRQVDLFFGIDVFLMMDFQSVFVYLLSAARLLRVGGRFAGTFGNAESPSGWDRLVRDATRHSAFALDPDTRFHWVNGPFLDAVFAKLGFRMVHRVSDDSLYPNRLDIARHYVVAELIDPDAAALVEHQFHNRA